MIVPLFGTKSALDHPADRPAILRIFLSDRYPLFPQHHRVFDSFSHFAGPEPGLLVASPPGLRREIPPTASDIRPRHACTAPANAAGFPSFPPKFRLLPYRSCDGTGGSERPCGASLRPLSPPAGGGTETPGTDTGSERSPPDVFPAPGAGNLNFT